MKKVIFTCANRSWLQPCRVTVRSIQENAPGIDIFVFTNQRGFTKIPTDTINFGTHGNDPEPQLIQLQVDLPEGPIREKQLIVPEDSMCLRMKALGYLKEKGYDVALYLDSDAVLIKPLPDDFWKHQNGAVQDLLIKAYNGTPLKLDRLRKDFTRKYIYDQGHQYFNSGVMRLDLKQDRYSNLFEYYLEYRMNPVSKKGICLDQDFFNVILLNDVEFLPYSYNTHLILQDKYSPYNHTWESKTETLEEFACEMNCFIKKNTFVMHYAGLKPWEKPNIKKVGMWKLTLGHHWSDIAKRTEFLSEKFIDRLKEVDIFMNDKTDFLQNYIEPKPVPVRIETVQKSNTVSLADFCM